MTGESGELLTVGEVIAVLRVSRATFAGLVDAAASARLALTGQPGRRRSAGRPAAPASGQPVTRAAEAHLGRVVTAAELARISQAATQLCGLARQSAATSHHEPGSAGTIVARPGRPRT